MENKRPRYLEEHMSINDIRYDQQKQIIYTKNREIELNTQNLASPIMIYPSGKNLSPSVYSEKK